MTDSSPDPQSPCFLIYDGQCRLCVTAKRGLERVGGDAAGDSVRLITYQSEEAKAVLGTGYRPGRPDVAYLVSPNGEVAKGLDAFLPLLPGLKGGRFLRVVLRLPGAMLVGKLLYRIVARYRYQLFGEVLLERHSSLGSVDPVETPHSSRPRISP